MGVYPCAARINLTTIPNPCRPLAIFGSLSNSLDSLERTIFLRLEGQRQSTKGSTEEAPQKSRSHLHA